MGHVLTEGEQVYYDRDYSKGRKRSGNIAITNKRLISTVESKKEVTKIECRLEDVIGAQMKFKPTSVIAFVASGIYTIIGIIINFIPKLMGLEDDPTGPVSTSNDFIHEMFLAYMIFFIALAVISFIIGLLSLRNGYYILIKTQPCDYYSVSLSANMGTMKPIKIKPQKDEALDIMNTFPAALISIKRANLNK